MNVRVRRVVVDHERDARAAAVSSPPRCDGRALCVAGEGDRGPEGALAQERRDKLTREAGLALQLSAVLALLLLVAVLATAFIGHTRSPMTAAGTGALALAWAGAALYLGHMIKRARTWAIDIATGVAALVTLGGLGVLIFGDADVNRTAVIVLVGLPGAAAARFLQTRTAVTRSARPSSRGASSARAP